MKSCWRSALLLLFAAVPVTAADTAVVAGQVVLSDGTSLGPSTILVIDGRIERIVPGRRPEAERVMEFPDSVVFPGLVDARTTAGLPGDPVEESEEVLPGLDVLDMANPEALEWHLALRGGVTTAAMVPGDRAVVGGTVAVVRTDPALPHSQRVLVRAAAVKAAFGNEPPEGNRPVRHGAPATFYYRRPTNRMGVAAEMRAWLRSEGQPPRVDGRVLPVWFTAREEQDVRGALRISREFGIAPVILDAAEGYKVASMIGDAGATVILGPLFNYPRRTMEFWEADEVRWNNPGILHEAGATIVIATAGEDPGSLRDLAAAAHRYGLPRKAALASVTSAAARALGVADRVGEIAPGMDADLVVLSGDPLEMASRVEAVIVGGRLAWERPVPPLTVPRKVEE